MGAQLTPAQQGAVSRISGLVLINAMIFQDVLASYNDRVAPLQKILSKQNFVNEFHTHWQFILTEIDYYPIFYVACEILASLSALRNDSLKNLAQAAQTIVGKRALLTHDLMGRVYHRLLSEAKYLGTYYTGIPAATLLLRLALRPDAWPLAWNDLDHVRQLRISDFACGTGTLLMAAAEAVLSNYTSASARQGQAVDLSALHKALVESILYGYDVLPSAVHLTASTLALKAPDVTFAKMNLFMMPLGGPQHQLGSIELLEHTGFQLSLDLFGAISQQVTGQAMKDVKSEPSPQLDLCVMNPPFTRSVGGNLLFGSVPENERQPMQARLKKLIQKHQVHASVTAGLGSVFVALADPYIKVGGRIALVLPKALLSGVSWKPTRQLIEQNYQLDYVVASQDPERWNFSESTSLSETLVVATKIDKNSPPARHNVIALNLWRNPSTAIEALAVAHTLLKSEPPKVVAGQGALELTMGSTKLGEAIAIPWDDLKSQSSWLLPCAFAQSDLVRASYHLEKGKLWLPGHSKRRTVPLCALSDLGTLGPDRRDIHDGFRLSLGLRPTTYPTFWGHDAKAVFTMAQQPNTYLSPLPTPKPGRTLRKVEDLWPKASTILIAERMWLYTQSLVSVRLTRAVLSNVWWSFSFKKQFKSARREKALVLWFNSTLGLLLMLAHREETRGAWVDFKKPILAALPVLDVSKLEADKLRELAAAYDTLSEETLSPLPTMNTDEVRAKIDDAVAHALKLPDFSVLREMLAREPGICLKQLS